jgi:hypothetical protein
VTRDLGFYLPGAGKLLVAPLRQVGLRLLLRFLRWSHSYVERQRQQARRYNVEFGHHHPGEALERVDSLLEGVLEVLPSGNHRAAVHKARSVLQSKGE